MYETSEWFATRFPRLLMSSSTDDGWAGNDYQDRPAEVGTAAFTTVDPNNGYIDSYYGAMYQGVRNCNYAVIKFAEAPVSDALKSYEKNPATYSLRSVFSCFSKCQCPASNKGQC